MNNLHKHLIHFNTSVRQALIRLDELAEDAILFIVNDHQELLGSLTDGDLRRGFIQGLGFSNDLVDFIQKHPKFISENKFSLKEIKEYRKGKFKVLPIINESNKIIDVINFNHQQSYLPIDAMIMAGGRGERLKPLTDTTPKPLLKIGDKPIVDYVLQKLAFYGVNDLSISLRYLGEQIENHIINNHNQNFENIEFIYENEALGTAGCLSLKKKFNNDHILLMNSDLLTNLDLEEFYDFYLENNADLVVACVPYQVSVPYAVIHSDENFEVNGFKEKPTFSYLANAGVYLMKKECVSLIPYNQTFNATDLLEKLISEGRKVLSYSFSGYWLDIGRHEDFQRAQKEITKVKI